MPFSSSLRTHWRLFCSSNRALSSTITATCFVGGVDQALDHLRVARRAVDGGFDREHVGIVGGGVEEALDGAVEGVVRVMEEHVVARDFVEQVGTVEAHVGVRPLREPWVREWRPPLALQVGAVQVDERREVAVVERAGTAEHLFGRQIELGAEQVDHRLGRVGVDFEADCSGEPPLFDHLLDGLDEVLGNLLVAAHLRVARDPEEGGVEHLDVRHQEVEVGLDEVLEEDVPRPLLDGDETGAILGNFDPGEDGVLVGVVADEDAEREAAVGDEREGVGGVERQRGQRRQDGLLEVRPQPVAFGRGEGRVVDDFDTRLGERGADHLAVTLGLPVEHRPGRVEDLAPLLAGRPAVDRGVGDAGVDLLFQAADPLHEELVEVPREQAEKPHALEEWRSLVERLVEDASLELEVAQLTVQVVSRVVEIGGVVTSPGRIVRI